MGFCLVTTLSSSTSIHKIQIRAIARGFRGTRYFLLSHNGLACLALTECLVERVSGAMLVLNSTAKFFLGLDLKGSLGFLRML